MQLSVINNPDPSHIERYEIARAVFAETGGRSLRSVEALTSMIANAARAADCRAVDIVRNAQIFTSRDKASPNNHLWGVFADNAGFQMCLRVAQKMLNGGLGDLCCGATRFHNDTCIPEWAMSRGYISEVDGLLFYL